MHSTIVEGNHEIVEMKDRLRVLIVDDDCMMAQSIADILKVEGYYPETASSGDEALKKIEEGTFDTVLIDSKMPGMSGWELCRAISDRRPGLPVKLMSAYAHYEPVQKGFETVAIHTLVKPLGVCWILNLLSSLHRERTIVVVDDDPWFCKILGDILEEREFSVVEITDPRSIVGALEAAGKLTILLDMKLDDADDFMFMVLQKVKEQFPRLPVILAVGYNVVDIYRKKAASAIEVSRKLDSYTCYYQPVRTKELLRYLSEIHQGEL